MLDSRNSTCVRAGLWVLLLAYGSGCGSPAEREPTSSARLSPQSADEVVELARRFVQPSNDLRLEALEDELQRRSLGYAVQSFPRSRIDDDRLSENGRSVGHNVVLRMGAGPPRIVVGAHFDAYRLRNGTLSHGVVDNAAGVIVLLRVAETIAVSALRSTVHVVFFDMEELGLLGSRAYVESLEQAPAAMVNVDIVAYGDTLLYGPGDALPDQPLASHVLRVCARYTVRCIGTPRMPSSDDRSFQRAGIPAISLAMLPADEAHRLWLLLNGELEPALRGALAPAIVGTIHTERDAADKLEPETLALTARIVTDLVLDLDAGAP